MFKCLALRLTDCHSKCGFDRKSSSAQIHGNCRFFLH